MKAHETLFQWPNAGAGRTMAARASNPKHPFPEQPVFLPPVGRDRPACRDSAAPSSPLGIGQTDLCIRSLNHKLSQRESSIPTDRRPTLFVRKKLLSAPSSRRPVFAELNGLLSHG